MPTDSSKSLRSGKFINFWKETAKILKNIKTGYLATIFSMAVFFSTIGWYAHFYYYGDKTVKKDVVEKEYVPVNTVRSEYIEAELVKRKYVTNTKYHELQKAARDSAMAASILREELVGAGKEIVAGKDIEKGLKNDLSRKEIEIEELKRRLEDAQKSLEDRKKAEILVSQIEDIRYEIRQVENDIDCIEDEIGSFRADAASWRKEYELYGRKQLYPNKETIVITEAFIKSLERDLNALPPPFCGILEEIKKEKLKIGDKVTLRYEGPKVDNITVAARYEAEAIALETKRQRLLEKLASLRTQLDGLIAATNDG